MRAQFVLGLTYDFGRGVPTDEAEAARWYRKAAEQGHARAQFFLGMMHDYGRGVPKDDVQAYMWFNLAGQTDAEARRARDGLQAQMTPEQIAEAQRLSREWKPTVPGSPAAPSEPTAETPPQRSEITTMPHAQTSRDGITGSAPIESRGATGKPA